MKQWVSVVDISFFVSGECTRASLRYVHLTRGRRRRRHRNRPENCYPTSATTTADISEDLLFTLYNFGVRDYVRTDARGFSGVAPLHWRAKCASLRTRKRHSVFCKIQIKIINKCETILIATICLPLGTRYLTLSYTYAICSDLVTGVRSITLPSALINCAMRAVSSLKYLLLINRICG